MKMKRQSHSRLSAFHLPVSAQAPATDRELNPHRLDVILDGNEIKWKLNSPVSQVFV